MLNPQEITRRWKTLRATLNGIKDPILRESFLAEYKTRAENEWGYCPDTSVKPQEYTAEKLPPIESLIYAKLQACKEYGVWEKDEDLDDKCLKKMVNMIDGGFVYSDLPEHLQCKPIFDLYIRGLGVWIEQQEKILKS